ncbi:MAG: FAD-dependent oxidoreductase, partial [Nannocystaceae bacterium]
MSAQGSSPQRVIILGGGYAGLSAAYALTQAPGWQQRFEVTIYQIGWRLGGKAASGRNPEFYGRNEARGPHLWMGGYHHAFALLDGCYRELGRQPPAPLPGWHEVVRPLHELYLGGRLGGGTGQMLPLPLRAGQPGGLHQPASIWACLVRMLRWVVQSLCTLNNHTYLVDWVATWPEARRRRLYASIRRAARYGVHEYRKRPPAGQDRLTCGFTAATAPLRETSLPGNPATVRVWVAPLLLFADYGLAALGAEGKTTPLHGIVELAATIARGLVEDRMYLRREFHNLRDIDFREWLHRNRARPQLLDHPALLGLYDLFLAYKNGDTRTPSLAASAALECITRGLCDGRGSLLYQFQSGPGEVVFAPLYEVLKRRGVKFRFFHRVKDIAANASGHGISQVTLGQQVLLHRPEDG